MACLDVIANECAQLEDLEPVSCPPNKSDDPEGRAEKLYMTTKWVQFPNLQLSSTRPPMASRSADTSTLGRSSSLVVQVRPPARASALRHVQSVKVDGVAASLHREKQERSQKFELPFDFKAKYESAKRKRLKMEETAKALDKKMHIGRAVALAMSKSLITAPEAQLVMWINTPSSSSKDMSANDTVVLAADYVLWARRLKRLDNIAGTSRREEINPVYTAVTAFENGAIPDRSEWREKLRCHTITRGRPVREQSLRDRFHKAAQRLTELITKTRKRSTEGSSRGSSGKTIALTHVETSGGDVTAGSSPRKDANNELEKLLSRTATSDPERSRLSRSAPERGARHHTLLDDESDEDATPPSCVRRSVSIDAQVLARARINSRGVAGLEKPRPFHQNEATSSFECKAQSSIHAASPSRYYDNDQLGSFAPSKSSETDAGLSKASKTVTSVQSKRGSKEDNGQAELKRPSLLWARARMIRFAIRLGKFCERHTSGSDSLSTRTCLKKPSFGSAITEFTPLEWLFDPSPLALGSQEAHTHPSSSDQAVYSEGDVLSSSLVDDVFLPITSSS